MAWAGRDTFQISVRDDSKIVFTAATIPVPDGWHPILNVALTVNATSLQLTDFHMIRPINDRCQLGIEATDVEYAITVDLPDEIVVEA